MKLTLHFDGAIYPNPGGDPRYGWHVDGQYGERVASGNGVHPAAGPEERTNNVAEFAGLIAGLKWLVDHRLPFDRLDVRGDSQVVVNLVNRKWKARKPHLRRLRDEALVLLRALGAGVIVAWVPRAKNAVADRIAAGRNSDVSFPVSP